MAIEFYNIDDIGLENKLFEISQTDFDYLDDILMKLTQVSGIVIDLYGRTVVYGDHVQYLINNLRDFLSLSGYNEKYAKKNSIQCSTLASIIKKLEIVKSGAIIIGD